MARRAYLILTLALVAAGGAAAWRMQWRADAAVPQQEATPGVPVQVASARRADVPISLSGLGTVQPLNVVTVTSRVDGQIMRIGFEEGQTVKEGDLLAQIDPRPYQASLDQAKARQAQDEAQLANARRDLARYAQLAQNNYASRQQLDAQRASVAQLEAAVLGDKAAVESAQVQLDYTTIRAPMTGRAGFRLVDQGNLVRASDAAGIVTLSQIEPITAVFTLPERDFGQVAAATRRGEVPATAISPDGQELAQGELTVLNSQIDQATGTFKAKATFANSDGALWPGQSVSVRIQIDTLRNVVTVPEDALQRGPSGYFAFVLKPDQTAERRGVTVARQARDVVVVAKGIDAGDRVVTAGASRVEAGAPLEITDAAPPEETGSASAAP
ncbi:efflux RND transporter periplasmic adaptor subunit [Hansschlegelia sp.]|uniref:efflux RND transporter periplasmic adaptor subunit n=1 Tax=Hansschlegelia sp. TaxID=2041892 RepID=UPI002CEC8B9E|nr:efflux RND transporter periplasmic adaptor subunit [Hansschlegelia sp.]HVI30106.1 efflux RND transporter periplasmic adaptor subunit [Hansschlegelia sp.]